MKPEQVPPPLLSCLTYSTILGRRRGCICILFWHLFVGKKLWVNSLEGLLVAMPCCCLSNSLNYSQSLFAQRNALKHTVFNGTVLPRALRGLVKRPFLAGRGAYLKHTQPSKFNWGGYFNQTPNQGKRGGLQLRLLVCPCSLHVCCLPEDVGANPRPSSFCPFSVFISCPLSEVPVLPATADRAEKGLLDHFVAVSALASLGESW